MILSGKTAIIISRGVWFSRIPAIAILLISVLEMIFKDYWVYWANSIYFQIFAVIVFVELVFALYIDQKYISNEVGLDHLPEMDHETMNKFVSEVMDPRSIPCNRQFIQGWFKGTPVERISKSDVLDWISSVCCNKSFDKINQEKAVVIPQFESFQEVLGHRFEEGHPPAQKILLTTEPVYILHRPLMVYGAIKCFDLGFQYWLRRSGFEKIKERHIVTYYRIGNDSRQPIVFFHGLGIGLPQYSSFLGHLLELYPNRTIVMHEMTSISMKLTTSHCLPITFAASVANILHRFDIKNVLAIGHSMGTVLIRWMDKFYPDLIQNRVFIDPICFSLWTHHTTQNIFERRPPGLRQAILRTFIVTEPGIALYLRRFFVWFHNTYFSQELPSNSVIYIAEKDDIIDSQILTKYLANFLNPTRKVYVLNEATHGAGILYPKFYKDILKQL